MINFGPYELDGNTVDVNTHLKTLITSSKEGSVKATGAKNYNLYYPIQDYAKKSLIQYMNATLGTKLDWNFEYFHSGEPVGLHTDYDTVPWGDDVKCHVLAGVIIPLEWTCKQPYTVFYDRVADEPRKLLYRFGEMRYKDTSDPIPYRNDWIYDDDVMKYNPRHTFHAKEYADLKIHSVYEWKIGTMCVFDTSRWHSSSWFLSTNEVPDVSVEYKRSIVGFGSIDV